MITDASMGLLRGQTWCDLTSDGGTDYFYGALYETATDDFKGFAVCRTSDGGVACLYDESYIENPDDWMILSLNNDDNDIRPGGVEQDCDDDYYIDGWDGGRGWDGHMVIYAYYGEDTIVGGPNEDILHGEYDNDILYDGGSGDSYLYGEGGNDDMHDGLWCYGGAGAPSCSAGDCCYSCTNTDSCGTP